jgi:hypothetical protein
MPDPIQALLASGAVPTTAFPSNSRYVGVDVLLYADDVSYLRRRFCPRPEATLYEYTVIQGDRRDLLAARHLGDPELWWRLADVNGIIDPRDLDETGRVLRLPGAPNV